MSWSIAIISYREFSIVMCIESEHEGIATPLDGNPLDLEQELFPPLKFTPWTQSPLSPAFYSFFWPLISREWE